MKILRPVHGAAGIFFPIGRPENGGTCQYADDKCLKKCYALVDKDYDEMVNVPEEDKRKIHRFFVEKSLLTICNEIVKEMDELQVKILSWFDSGDCLDKHVDKFYQIMVLLNGESVIQNGFTRNETLYRKIVYGGVIKYFVLTIKSKSYKDAPPFKEVGLWGIPDYKNGLVRLHYGTLGRKSYGSCGSGSVITKFEGKEIEIAANCLGCYNRKVGCFIKKAEEAKK